MKLELLGKIVAAGFGDKVLLGLIMGILENVTPDRCCEYIDENMELGHWVSDNDWDRFRRMAKGANVKDITSDDIINDLRKNRTDILSVIINHPQGEDWLQSQINIIKEKLEI